METTIRNIASLHSGIYAKPDYQGDVYYVQARHFNAQKEFDTRVQPDLQLEGSKLKNNLLQPGDVLLAVRGNNNFAVQYKGIIKPAVASTMFVVIRILDQNLILPEYLTWFLNLSVNQSKLQNKAKGTSILSLSKFDIEDLEIIVPPMQKQKAVLEFDALKKKELTILKKLQELKEKEIQHLLLTSLK